jgi:glycine betaine catabolism B
MKFSVRAHIIDLLAFKGLNGKRVKRFEKSAATLIPTHPVNELAAALHPTQLDLVISDMRDETKSARTYRLIPDPDSDTNALPTFRAGQYLSLTVNVGGARITRPYSISSAPYEAAGPGGFYEITIRQVADGFLTPHTWAHWDVGIPVTSSGPLGTFYHEPLRDARTIVGLAGGSGITPFRSMAREIVRGKMDAELLLLYGSSDEEDIVAYDELAALANEAPDKLRVVHILSCEEVTLPGCEQGFISAEIIRQHADVENSSFFVCGPQAMYEYVVGELAQLDLAPKRVRREVFGGVKGIATYPGFPEDVVDQTFHLTVRIGAEEVRVPAKATETLLVAMERANLAPPSQCRSGECGFCRSRLESGEVYVVADTDARRAADAEYGCIHPCSSYPLSDLRIVVPRA